jgi:GWxTD domain-containing protein
MKPIRYIKLLTINDPDSLAAVVHHFWRDKMDSTTAQKVAAKYYRRVRQANRLFTSYKEGWKTARGTFYVLFGPPDKVIYSDPYSSEVRRDIISVNLLPPPEGWRYGGPWGVEFIAFWKVPPPSPNFPFKHFMTNGPGDVSKRNMQRLWRTGKILHTKLPHYYK